MFSATRMIGALALCALPLALAAQVDEYREVTDERLREPEPGSWLMFRGSYDGWGYSQLDSITRENVGRLRPVWTLSTGLTEGHQAPPVVNDGIMYVTTPLNTVLAIDAATGEG